jgi:hypothetical protein
MIVPIIQMVWSWPERMDDIIKIDLYDMKLICEGSDIE